MIGYVRIGWRNLVQARRRSLLLGSAIAFVAMLLIFMFGVSQGAARRLIDASTTLSAGHVNIGGFFKQRAKSATPVITDREKIKALVRAKIGGISSVIDRQRGWGRMIGPDSSINVGMNGVVYADEGRLFKSLTLAPEKEYRKNGGDAVHGDFSQLAKDGTAVVFAAQAKKLGVGVGDTVTFITEASGGQTNTVDLTVAAVARDMGMISNWNVIVPRKTVLDLYRFEADTTGAVMIYLDDIDRADAVMLQLRTVLADAGYGLLDHDPRAFFMKFDKIAAEDWRGLKLDLTTWKDEVSFIMVIVTSLDALSVFLVGILSLIIATGITNSLWMSVRERTKEIGTVRAIGMQKNQVLWLFLVEAGMLGLVAALAGAGLGAALVWLINAAAIPVSNDGMKIFLMSDVLRLAVSPKSLVATVLGFTLLTAVAALYPAWRASRLTPVKALQHSK